MTGAKASFRQKGATWRDDQGGFSLAEVMAASLILIVVVVSLSNLLVDSLSSALIVKQRETAASLASDTVENVKALVGGGMTSANQGTTPCTSMGATSVPIRAATDIQQCYTLTVDSFTYTVTPTVTIAALDTCTVAVTWASGHNNYSYVTSSDVSQ